MRRFLGLVSIVAFSVAGTATANAEDCQEPDDGIGVSRVITIDTKGGGEYGTFQYPEKLGLKDGEVVLTFDDGPHADRTRLILQTLKDFCTKATFFSVGQMARTYPQVIKEVSNAGHTVGTHTWRHANLSRTRYLRARQEVERGFAAVSLATGGKVAPFFRFPGLRHSKDMKAHLAEQNIATFSVDIISGDTTHLKASTIIRQTLARLKAKKKGVILFHDLKLATVRALPTLLKKLKKGGYKIVHLVPKSNLDVDVLMANNRKKDEKAGQVVASTMSEEELEKYFGQTWQKRTRHTILRKKKQVAQEGDLFRWLFH